MSWLRSGNAASPAPTVSGDVSGVVNTGANATIIQAGTTRPRRVFTHEQMIVGLHGRRTYLQEAELRFIGPGSGHEADPPNLLARLSRPDPRGILVVGPAGAGKTRTCFEVAARAHAEGLRVLHIPASPVVTVEELAGDVFGFDDRRVLLVFDYLDACPQLDLRALANGFLADARRSGTDVACIASARPGSVRALEQRGAGWLFDPLTLRSDQGYRSEIADRIVQTIAPTAIQHFGEEAIATACGRRPIIALLIAQAIERSFVDGRPIPRGLASRSGELRPWLQEALRHDQLTSTAEPGRGPLDLPTPSVQELACAVAVSACPQPRHVVEAIVETFLTADGPSPFTGRETVEVLLSLGWLDETAGELFPVHDAVTDELLTQAMMPSPGHSVHRSSAEALCAAVSWHSTSFALFADHMRRIMADLSTPERQHAAEAFERFCHEWTVEHRDVLGEFLAHAGKDGERALLTMILERPWREATQQSWARIGTPWLQRSESIFQATPFLAAALRSDAAPSILVAEALSWLSRRSGQTDAHDVIKALISRTDLLPAQNDLVQDHAIAWVREHPRWPAAPEILTKLLEHDASPAKRLEAANCALSWLTPRRPGAAAVLRRLLEGKGWTGEFLDSIVSKALAWVAAKPAESTTVLACLLRNSDLTEPQRRSVRETGLLWLQENPSGPGRNSLIFALLAGEDNQESLDTLCSYVNSSSVAEVDPLVIHQILESKSIDARRARSLADVAFRWLDDAHDPEARRLVLASLMGRGELTTPQTARLAEEAMALLDKAPDPRYLTVLLHRGFFMNEQQIRQVVSLTLRHCRSQPSAKQRRSLINALLLRRDLTFQETRNVVAAAVKHIDTDRGSKSGRLLTSLAERNDLTPIELDQVLSRAFQWLENHRDISSNVSLYLIRDLLQRPDLPPEAFAVCERHARELLAETPPENSCVELIRAHISYP